MFPKVKPYPQQVAYMQHILAALAKKENAMLESPTGTGKTLALLAASLHFLERLRAETPPLRGKEKKPPVAKVIYTSRTHS